MECFDISPYTRGRKRWQLWLSLKIEVKHAREGVSSFKLKTTQGKLTTFKSMAEGVWNDAMVNDNCGYA